MLFVCVYVSTVLFIFESSTICWLGWGWLGDCPFGEGGGLLLSLAHVFSTFIAVLFCF